MNTDDGTDQHRGVPCASVPSSVFIRGKPLPSKIPNCITFMPRSSPAAWLLLAAAAVAAACAKPTPPPKAPPEVSVVTVEPRTVDDRYEFLGDVEPSRSVAVRAQGSGTIVERSFREGTTMRPGDVLYRIDPRNSDADVRSAEAGLAEAEARLANATSNVARFRALLADNAVARQDADNAEAEEKRARAAVSAAHAAIDRARKSLDDTYVRAEIGGRVGRALLDVGSRVTGPGDVLTTIDVLDPIYVSFRPSAQQEFQWRRDPATRTALAPGGPATVRAVLGTSEIYPRPGRIGFVDPVVDAATGTRQYRAQFDNPDQLLLPGQFLRVRLEGIKRNGTIVVPQRAVLQQMGRQIVYVVAAGDTVRAADVVAGAWTGGDWVIQDGLHGGERVIVDGVQKVSAGMRVRPTPLAAAETASTAAQH